MTLLVDHEIEMLVGEQDIISPWDVAMLQPTSVDLRLGNLLLLENPVGSAQKFWALDISDATEDRPAFLKPGEFALAATQERLSLPADVSGELCLKSSAARTGLDHCLAGWIDCGYCGNPTLELKNALQHHAIPLWPGMPIVQVKLFRHSVAANPYGKKRGSHYQGDSRPEPAWTEPTNKAPF